MVDSVYRARMMCPSALSGKNIFMYIPSAVGVIGCAFMPSTGSLHNTPDEQPLSLADRDNSVSLVGSTGAGIQLIVDLWRA